MMDLTQNYFELFNLPVSFSVDSGLLRQRYTEAQQVMHPDRFAGGTDQERRLAMQMSTHVNEGYKTLLEPLARAAYLLSLQGVKLEDEPNRIDPEFLEAQLQLRESLSELKADNDPWSRIDALKKEAGDLSDATLDEIETLFGREAGECREQLVEQIRRLQFISKFQKDLCEFENRLLDEE